MLYVNVKKGKIFTIPLLTHPTGASRDQSESPLEIGAPKLHMAGQEDNFNFVNRKTYIDYRGNSKTCGWDQLVDLLQETGISHIKKTST